MKRGKDYIGVGVGAFIVDAEGKKVLLVRRKKAPEAGYWSIPGGAVEFGETFEQAIVREIKEETGLDIKIIRFLSLTDHILPEEGLHWVTPQYVCEVVGGSLCNCEPEKHEALQWVPFDNLPELLTIPTVKAFKDYKRK